MQASGRRPLQGSVALNLEQQGTTHQTDRDQNPEHSGDPEDFRGHGPSSEREYLFSAPTTTSGTASAQLTPLATASSSAQGASVRSWPGITPLMQAR